MPSSVVLLKFAAMTNAKDRPPDKDGGISKLKLVERFGKKTDMEAILFSIGVPGVWRYQKKFSKEQKQDLMHVAVLQLFAQSGYYELEKVDEDGLPHLRIKNFTCNWTCVNRKIL